VLIKPFRVAPGVSLAPLLAILYLLNYALLLRCLTLRYRRQVIGGGYNRKGLAKCNRRLD
jgi:hypothetical protein